MQHLQQIIANATVAIEAAESLVALDEVRVQYLGKKGELTAQLQSLGKLPPKSAARRAKKLTLRKRRYKKPLLHVKTTYNVQSLKRSWRQKRWMSLCLDVVSKTEVYTL